MSPSEHAAESPQREATVALPHRAAATNAEPVADLVGRRLGRYVVCEELGRGGMGVVHLARDTELRRDVALKVLPLTATGSAEMRARFRREARAMARVIHPGVVRIHEVLEVDGLVALVMERVEGCSLADLVGELSERSLRGERPDLAAALRARGVTIRAADAASPSRWFARLGSQLADALQAVHDAGVLHRDVKPSNVLIDAAGRPYLTDFGVALDPQATDPTQGGVCGTTPYSPPEQLRGDDDLDVRCDVYGLGATLYEAIALRPPATGSPATVQRIVESRRVPYLDALVRGVPRDLATVVHRAIDPLRTVRYPSAAAFGADLRAVATGELIEARRASRLRRAGRWLVREPSRAVALAAALMAVALSVSLVLVLPFVESARRAERRERARQLVAEGLTLLSLHADQDAAMDRLLQATRAAPDSAEAVACAALAWTLVGRPRDAAALVESRHDLVAATPGLAELLDNGIDPNRWPSEELASLRIGDGDWFVHFLAGYAAQQRGYGSSREGWARLALTCARRARDLPGGADQELARDLLVLALDTLDDADLVDSCETLAASFPDRWSAQLHVAQALARRDPARAMQACERARALGAPPATILQVAHRILDEPEDHERVLALADDLLAAHPDEPRLLTQQLQLRQRCGATRAELAPLRSRALAAYEARVATGSALSGTWLALARIHEDAGDLAAAVEVLRRGAAQMPDSWPVLTELARLVITQVEERAAEIRKTLAAGRRQVPPVTLESMGESIAELDRSIAEGRAFCERALELAPYHGQVVQNAALMYARTIGDRENAHRCIELAVRLDPRVAADRLMLGMSCVKLGDIEGAIEQFTIARELDPEDPLAMFELGRALFLAGQLDAARPLLAESIPAMSALPRKPVRDLPIAMACLARICISSEVPDREAAYAWLDRMRAQTRIPPNSAVELSAEVYLACGEPDRARAALEGAVRCTRQLAELEPIAARRQVFLEELARLEGRLAQLGH
ncbi:MAG: protein kinase [Planctomycetes bacterium]|nr:protein kinase [Planctomycetota bacterium]